MLRKGRYKCCGRKQDLVAFYIHAMRKSKSWICSQLLSFCHTQASAISQRIYHAFFSLGWVQKPSGIFTQFLPFDFPIFRNVKTYKSFKVLSNFLLSSLVSPFTLPLIYPLCSLLFSIFMSSVFTAF